MNLSRLMVLGLLAGHGPRHGHLIRRDAERTNVGNWGGVSVGALYREIRQMEREGLLQPMRTEQPGRRPARTIYRITEAGSRELRTMRGQAIRELRFGPDTFGVAMVFGGTWGPSELGELLRDRRQTIAAALAGVENESSRLEALGEIGPLDVAMFRRRAMQLEAELRWHDEFDRVHASLPESAEPAAATAGAQGDSAAEETEPTADLVAREPLPDQVQAPPRVRGAKKRRRT